MSRISILFSFTGRVSRKSFWLASLFVSFALILAESINSRLGYKGLDAAGFSKALFGPGLLIVMPVLWLALAIIVKRWHDRNKSGWWALISLIPVIGPIWSLIETGFLRGTTGENRYGMDPLQDKA